MEKVYIINNSRLYYVFCLSVIAFKKGLKQSSHNCNTVKNS